MALVFLIIGLLGIMFLLWRANGEADAAMRGAVATYLRTRMQLQPDMKTIEPAWVRSLEMVEIFGQWAYPALRWLEECGFAEHKQEAVSIAERAGRPAFFYRWKK
jgi:hypothetical protein